jgi:molybdenum cofactor cytidylyltransferase
MTQGFPWAILLAGGAGRRFGGQKLTADLGGTPMIGRVLAELAESRRREDIAGVIVVVRAGDLRLAELAAGGAEVVRLPVTAPVELAASLRAGIAALKEPGRRPVPAAVLICLADQPGLRADVIAALVTGWRRDGALAARPRYPDAPDVPGHPALLDRSLWPLADEASGDTGLGPVLARRPGLVTTIDVPGRNPDIDTPADLADYLRRGTR